MGYPSYYKVVCLDGIAVPVRAVRFSWTDMIQTGLQVDLLPGFKGQILPSTVVHVFSVETGQYAFRRYAVEVDASQVGRGPADTSYLKTTWPEAVNYTYGDTLYPDALNPPRSAATIFDVLSSNGAVYLGGGIVDTQSTLVTASSERVTRLSCLGAEGDASLVQLIQLVRGRGTLADAERRFFGQEGGDKDGSTGKSILNGKGRNAFADGLVKTLLDDPKDFTLGLRKIIAQYPALVNPMWRHRFAWNRFGDQIFAPEGDSSVSRLLGSASFKEFIRARMQQMYQVPLVGVIASLLEFVGYKMAAQPAPLFIPLVPRREPRIKIVEDESSRQVNTGVSVRAQWGRSLRYRASEAALYPGWKFEVQSGLWFAVNPDDPLDKHELETILFGAGECPGKISKDLQRVEFTLPLKNGRGEPVFAAGLEMEVDANISVPGAKAFKPGKSYKVNFAFTAIARGAAFQGLLPRGNVPFTLHILLPGFRTVTKKTKREEELPLDPITGYQANTFCRLNTYTIMPHLWFACPPVCNIILPEMCDNIQMDFSGLNSITRLLGKIPPGVAGSGKSFLDKFSAPNTADLNAALKDADDDPLDAQNLRKVEYIAGVRGAVENFGVLAKLVNQSDWNGFIRSWLVQQYWSLRLGANQATLSIKPHTNLVVGTTVLVIAKDTARNRAVGANPETVAALNRLKALRDALKRLKKCRAAKSGLLAKIKLILEWVATCRRLSGYLYSAGMLAILTNYEYHPFWSLSGSTAVGVDVYSATQFISRLAAGDAEADNRTGKVTSFASTQPQSTVSRFQSIGSPLPSYVVEGPSFETAFRQLLGDGGMVIFPRGARIQRLPSVAELDALVDALNKRVPGIRACIASLDGDIALLQAEIDRVRAIVSGGLSSSGDSAQSFFGYVSAVSETVTADGRPVWNVSLTHVRFVGADLDSDGIAGDDVESTVVFSENGYLDERYSHNRIGKELYRPAFGTDAIVDLDWVQERVRTENGDEPASVTTDIEDITSKFEHPAVCGHACHKEGASSTDIQAPDVTSAAQAIIDAYHDLVDQGADSAAIFDWHARLTARPHMTWGDAYRGAEVSVDWERENALKTWPGGFSEPEVDAQLYGERDDLGQDASSAPPEGFFKGSIRPVGSTTQEELARQLAFAGDLKDNEVDLLRDRQARVQSYLENLRDRTTRE